MNKLPGLLALLLLAGCAGPQLRVACSRGEVPNAEYVGTYYGVENVIPVQAMAQDLYCADAFAAAQFPRGFVTLYGSSRIRADDPLYQDVRAFATAWTQRHGRQYPVMTGAGPGLMEAANEGARAAGGPSVGYTTYYDRALNPTPSRPYGGDAGKALNRHVTHGLVFSSVVMREQAMIKHSAAMVIAPGGSGTEWETFQILETIKSGQLAKVPVYFLGDRQKYWASLEARLRDMDSRGTLRLDEVKFVQFVADGDALLRRLEADLPP